MGLELVDFSKTYEIQIPKDASVIFVLRHWTNGMQDEVDRACLVNQGENKFSYDIAKEREMKINLSLADWRGVSFEGKEVPCTPENKKMLPPGITLWLQKEIEERAGLRITQEEKKS